MLTWPAVHGEGPQVAGSGHGRQVPATTGKVRIGFLSFTEVTEPGAHHSYNEWHQLDHLPEQLPLPGVAWGQRWVSTPACNAARAVDGELLRGVHYVTLYLMTDPVPETLDAFADLGRELRLAGRFHRQRRAHLSGPFVAIRAVAHERVLVSPAAVPYRPNTGVYVVVEEAPAGGGADRASSPDELESLLEVDGVAGAWLFASGAAAGGAAPDRPGRWRPGDRRVSVCWLDGDPLVVARSVAPVVEGWSQRRQVVFAGPFETVVPWRWDWFDEP